MTAVASPILLTVDDDPEVSRSLARDLRQQYGADYRIRRAESGPAALEALKELKLRDERVGLLLADHRMPEMTGVEFLEQARQLYPTARRVLLTAYADTDAAIGAINRADVHYYMLKPWDPPQEKLYPVLDDLLEDWRMQDRMTAADRIRVVGHRWSAPSHAVKDFLTRNQVPFKWLELERDPEAGRLLAANGSVPEHLPLVITEDGRTLQAPTPAELAGALGLSTTPSLPFYDLIVIGGGPAGLGAAVYGASEGLRTVLVEREAIGGQAGQSARIENYLGFPAGIAGGDLARRATTQARRFGAEMLLTSEVSALEVCGSARVVRLADGGQLSAHAVLLTTGVAYRRLQAPRIEELTGSGVYYGATSTESQSCHGEDVYVVGGANSAGQAAVFFARTARTVTLVVRGPNLERSMSHYLIHQLTELPNVRIRTSSEVVGVSGGEHLERVRIAECQTGAEEEVETSWLFVFIGAAPGTSWLGKQVQRDANGFVLTGPDLVVDGQLPAGWPLDRQPYFLETSVPGVFAAGDVRGQSVKRVASAVGEGAMAVTLVHRYLELL
ncbi:MAG: thioredoxin reductase [Actinomycetota bacterium]|nr:thioredoxin reductase [Actinomycetota bacterium]